MLCFYTCNFASKKRDIPATAKRILEVHTSALHLNFKSDQEAAEKALEPIIYR